MRPLLPLLLLAPFSAFADDAHARHDREPEISRDWEDRRGDHEEYRPDYGQPVMVPVTVFNEAGGTVQLNLPGRPPVVLANHSSIPLTLPAGYQELRASYRLFGNDYPLEEVELYLRPGRPATAVIPPAKFARFQVSNLTGAVGTVFKDGSPLAELRPGESRVFASPPGVAELSFQSGGRVVDSERINLVPIQEIRWTAELPPVGDLVVVNPFPMAVELVCDRGFVRTLPPFGSTVYEDLPVGSFHLTARRVTDEYLADQLLPVRPGGNTTWKLDPPSKGLLVLDSDHRAYARVYVDGRQVAGLAPDQVRRLQLPVGWHELSVRDERGYSLVRRWIEVDPFTDEFLKVGRDYGRSEGGYASNGQSYGGYSGGTSGGGSSCSMPSGH
jgi:hypothetical protein